MGDGVDDGWPQDAHRELWAVQLPQKVLAHVFGQRIAVGRPTSLSSFCACTARHNNVLRQCNIPSNL